MPGVAYGRPEALDPSRSTTMADGFGHDFSRISVQSPAPMVIQPKLKISMPGDPGEQEADRVADEVMRMPESQSSPRPYRHEGFAGPLAVQRACSCGGQSSSDENEHVNRSPALSLSPVEGGALVRMIDPKDIPDSQPVEETTAAAEAEATKETPAATETIQTKAAGGTASRAAGQTTTSPTLTESIGSACRSGGQFLPVQARQFMEPRFGLNFADVRIHADSVAGDLAYRVQARAFATGNHVFFAPGEFQPERTTGRQLLAHELAHVVQQSKGSSGGDRLIQCLGVGGLNCPPYASYDKTVDLKNYNCAGLAHRTYDFKSLTDTKAALVKGSTVAAGTPCDHVGVVKHWLWEYDIRMEDSSGNVLVPTWQDFHTVGGPTDGDPLPKDSDEYFTKNGARKVYGPGTAPSFKPVPKDQALTNDPSETPIYDKGLPVYKVRSNIKESCYCLPCPSSKKSP